VGRIGVVSTLVSPSPSNTRVLMRKLTPAWAYAIERELTPVRRLVFMFGGLGAGGFSS
jgi:hypothetical protein